MQARPKLNQVQLEVVENNPTLEDYLQHLAAPLVRFIPYEKRVDFIEEVRGHLEQAISMRTEAGTPLEQATREAIERYGEAEVIADEFLETSYESTNRTPMTKRFGKANIVAYGVFQTALVLYLAVIQFRVFFPSPVQNQLPWGMDMEEFRSIWPAPLPLPEMTLQFFLVIGYPLIAPSIAGWIVGRLVPFKPARAVYQAMMPLCILTFIMGAVLLPAIECLLFGIFQVIFWLPVGCLFAHLSSLSVRRRGRKKWEAVTTRSPITKHLGD